MNLIELIEAKTLINNEEIREAIIKAARDRGLDPLQMKDFKIFVDLVSVANCGLVNLYGVALGVLELDREGDPVFLPLDLSNDLNSLL